jgi:hypothetical protein
MKSGKGRSMKCIGKLGDHIQRKVRISKCDYFTDAYNTGAFNFLIVIAIPNKIYSFSFVYIMVMKTEINGRGVPLR